MTWWAIEVRVAPADADAVGAWLVSQTGHAVEERDGGMLAAYAADEPSARSLAHTLRSRPGVSAAECVPVAEVDWSTRWRDGIAVRRIGRLTLAPTWRADAAHDPGIVLDPENAFGTGEHGSTRAALALLERHVAPGDRVLDLGSGSGILAIAAVKLGAARAVGIEIDPEGPPVAERNAARNGVAGTTSFLLGDAAVLAPLAGPAELVVSNILRSVNLLLFSSIRRAVTDGGLVLFSGMEEPESELFRPELARSGFAVVDDVVDAGWWAVAARVS